MYDTRVMVENLKTCSSICTCIRFGCFTVIVKMSDVCLSFVYPLGHWAGMMSSISSIFYLCLDVVFYGNDVCICMLMYKVEVFSVSPFLLSVILVK